MLISDINPHIRHANLITTPFKMRSEPSICMDCRLFFFENISGSFFFGEEKHNILNNTAIFFPPETEYELDIKFNENAGFYVFNFDLTNIHCDIKNGFGTPLKSEFDKSKVPSYEMPGEFSKPIIKNIAHVKGMVGKCVNNFILKNTFYREASSALLKMILLELVGEENHNAYSELCKNVLDYISENYKTSSLTNETISAHFNYHSYHLSSIVKSETGKSLHQFLIYYRLRKSRELLATTETEISEIAWKCGFSSAAYFTKLFKQNIGITPGDYRRRYTDLGF